MRVSLVFPVLATCVLVALPATAQQHAHGDTSPPILIEELLGDIDQVRQKLVGLAEAIPEESWDWRPGEGVRSVRDVVMHLAASNYMFTSLLGTPAPEETGVRGDDFSTVQAFEARELGKAGSIAALQASFDHLVVMMQATTPAQMEERIAVFGQNFSGRLFRVLATSHLHEHLGQLIAYARTNDVVPPWSAGAGGD